MATWLYAIVEAPHDPAAVDRLPPGVGSEPVRLVAAGDVAAVVGDVPREQASGLPSLLAHERVVEAVRAQVDAVLPARFGTRLAGDDAVRAQLFDRAAPLRAALGRVRGRVELAVRVAGEPDATTGPDATPALTGREWIARRTAERADEERLRTRVHGALAALAVDAVWRSAERGRRPATAAYLVDDAMVGAFRARADELAHEPGLRLTCTGPWPPYSFCSLDEVVA